MPDYSFRVKVKASNISSMEQNDNEWKPIDIPDFDNLRYRFTNDEDADASVN